MVVQRAGCARPYLRYLKEDLDTLPGCVILSVRSEIRTDKEGYSREYVTVTYDSDDTIRPFDAETWEILG